MQRPKFPSFWTSFSVRYGTPCNAPSCAEFRLAPKQTWAGAAHYHINLIAQLPALLTGRCPRARSSGPTAACSGSAGGILRGRSQKAGFLPQQRVIRRCPEPSVGWTRRRPCCSSHKQRRGGLYSGQRPQRGQLRRWKCRLKPIAKFVFLRGKRTFFCDLGSPGSLII